MNCVKGNFYPWTNWITTSNAFEFIKKQVTHFYMVKLFDDTIIRGKLFYNNRQAIKIFKEHNKIII